MAMRNIQLVVEDYVNTSSYEASVDVAAAKTRLAAALELSVRRPSKVMIDGNSTQFDYIALRDEIAYLRSWITANDTTTATDPSKGAVRTYDISDVRR